MSQQPERGATRGQMLIGKLSGRRIAIPDVNPPPMPALVEPGVILDGTSPTQFGRIGLLTPFDQRGNESAVRMFNDLGFDVAASVGFSCAHALHIAHLPDWAKERATMELLATDDNGFTHALHGAGRLLREF